MRHLSRDWVLGLLVTAAGAFLTLPLQAQNPSSNGSPGGVIRACVQKSGQLRLIDAGENCKRTEELVIWNVRGPRGLTGLNGANGSPGAPGKEGAPGRDGANGSPGIPGKQGPPGQDGEPGRDGRDGGNGSPGAIIVGSLAFGCEGSTFSVSSVGAAVRIPGTNFFVDVIQMRLEGAPGNTSPGPKPKKSKYFPFQIYNVPPGTWALEAGLVRIAQAFDSSSNSSSLAPVFQPLANVGHIVTHAGALVSLGEINLDTSCAVPPIEVCGNGIDDDGNDAVDENCPCSGASCVPATSCEDEDMVTCGDGTCRSSAAACPPAGGPPPPPPAACTTFTDQASCEARADCRAIIAGTNCHRPDGTTCQSGDVSCVCEAPFVFQACVGR